MSKEFSLRSIAENKKLYIASRTLTASNLSGSYLIIYENLSGSINFQGKKTQPLAVVIASFSDFGAAASHLKKMAKILSKRQNEWKDCVHKVDEMEQLSQEEKYQAHSDKWQEMIITISQEISEEYFSKRQIL